MCYFTNKYSFSHRNIKPLIVVWVHKKTFFFAPKKHIRQTPEQKEVNSLLSQNHFQFVIL